MRISLLLLAIIMLSCTETIRTTSVVEDTDTVYVDTSKGVDTIFVDSDTMPFILYRGQPRDYYGRVYTVFAKSTIDKVIDIERVSWDKGAFFCLYDTDSVVCIRDTIFDIDCDTIFFGKIPLATKDLKKMK